DSRRDAQDVPLLQLEDLIVQLRATGARDDDVDLLLLAVGVTHTRPETGAVAEVADAELLGVEVLARHPHLHVDTASRGCVVDVLEVLDRVGRAGHRRPPGRVCNASLARPAARAGPGVRPERCDAWRMPAPRSAGLLPFRR